MGEVIGDPGFVVMACESPWLGRTPVVPRGVWWQRRVTSVLKVIVADSMQHVLCCLSSRYSGKAAKHFPGSPTRDSSCVGSQLCEVVGSQPCEVMGSQPCEVRKQVEHIEEESLIAVSTEEVPRVMPQHLSAAHPRT